MTLLVDTSVWSLALRRDVEATEPEVQELKDALFGSDLVVTTGVVLQEVLQGFSGAKAQTQIIERFAALPLLQPDRDDHIGFKLQVIPDQIGFPRYRVNVNPSSNVFRVRIEVRYVCVESFLFPSIDNCGWSSNF